MGARQSKRSVDISATPPKKGAEENGGVATEDGSVKLIEKATENVENVKATLNGDATHTEQQEIPIVNGTESPSKTEPETPVKAEEATPETVTTPEKVESPEEVTSPVTSPDEKTPEDGDKTSEKPEKKKRKDSKIMKTLRSLSFSKKSKPVKTPVTSPSAEEKSEKSEENATEANKSEDPASPLAVIDETGAATKVEEPATEAKKEELSVCDIAKKEITGKVEAVLETVTNTIETKVTELVSEIKTEIAPAVEEVPPPLPASPPPTEIPTPVVAATETIKNIVNDHQQQEVEEMNGGGESLAEMTPEVEENPVLVNGDHAVTNGTNGIDAIDEEIKAPSSDKVEEDLSSKMESLKMQVAEDLPEISSQGSTKNEKKKKKGGKKKNAEKKSQGQTAK